MSKFLNHKSFVKFLVLVAIVFVFVQVSQAQKLYPISGGTRFESDPDKKKQFMLIAENSDLKITIKPAEKIKLGKGPIWAIWMKIENTSDKPLKFDPTQFNATDDEGRAFVGLESKDAIKRFYDSVAAMSNLVGLVVAGPLMGPSIMASGERKAAEELNRKSIQIGEIPPKTFKDGIVFFEQPKEKTKEFKINFIGLWSESIVFTTDEKRRPKTDK